MKVLDTKQWPHSQGMAVTERTTFDGGM